MYYQAVPVLLADANDSSALSKLASQTEVIIQVAGPYAKYGDKVVEASVNAGTHYCDLTGKQLSTDRLLTTDRWLVWTGCFGAIISSGSQYSMLIIQHCLTC